MSEISNNDLLAKVEVIIKNETIELKSDIQSLRDSLNEKTRIQEEKCNNLESRIIYIERFNKRNNIVIFGMEADKDNILEATIEKLNEIFNCNFSERNINNIYFIGKKSKIILEFISYLQKQKFFQTLKKLRGSVISISHDLGPEDQVKNEILVKHLESARIKNHQAYIKNLKLYVNGTSYTPEELESGSREFEIELLPKSNSASPTPTTSHKKEKEDIADNPGILENFKITEESIIGGKTNDKNKTDVVGRLDFHRI
ncbi:unnamed protein product [Phaedon cochleariae]|uniref:Endonuclease-reverse transcriptase n=1 Tax=Phaedon cochleariae TaxID=80249 RepID=A0A9N9SFQ8_PHACE|nr:unnamed protein product [Phaedon cochleariae]